MKKRLASCALALVVGTAALAGIPHSEPSNAEIVKTITASELRNKIEGGWLGALWGNFTGLPTEFKFVAQPGPDSALDWKVSNCYTTDDDTSFEYVFLHMMEVYGVDTICYEDMPEEWIYHFQDNLWVGNLAALDLMKGGYVPPETGKRGINPYFEAIDAQIECEIFGMITPGMLQNCYERTKWWMRAVGDGVVLENSAFYAMLCSDAFFCDDIHESLERVRGHFADTLTTAKIFDAVKAEYEADPTDWKAARQNLYRKYYVNDVLNCEINFAMTILSLFYGQNDYEKTVGIAVLAGFDNDCNAATAGTIMGIQKGVDGLPQKFLDASGDRYLNTNRPGLPSGTVSEIASRIAAQAQEVIIGAGGIKLGDEYTVYDGEFTPATYEKTYTKIASEDAWSYSGMNKFYNPDCSGGYGHGTMKKGGYAEITFTGGEITLYGATSPNGGRFAVSVDGEDMGTVDLRAEETFTADRLITMSYDQILKRVRGLDAGEHTLRVTALEDGKWHSVNYAKVVCSEDEYFAEDGLNYARTAAATPIASVMTPTGSGAGGGGVSRIRDGIFYAPDMHSSYQYDSYLGRDGSGNNYPKTYEDYIGYRFDRELTVGRIVFNEGGHWGADGGWFADGSMRVEVYVDGVWTEAEYDTTPAYPVGNTPAAMGEGGRTFTITLKTATAAGGVRLIGTPGGTHKLISCGELEVYKR